MLFHKMNKNNNKYAICKKNIPMKIVLLVMSFRILEVLEFQNSYTLHINNGKLQRSYIGVNLGTEYR